MLRRLLVIGIVVAAWAMNIASTGTSQANAIAIATVAGLVLPFLFKLVPAAGRYMVAIVVAVSLLAAVGAMLLSGDLVLNQLQNASVTTLLGLFMTVYGLGQLVYSTLTQHPDTQGAVAEPALLAPQPPAVPAA